MKKKTDDAPVLGVAFGGIVTWYNTMDDLRFREDGERLYVLCTLSEARDAMRKKEKAK